MKLMKKITAQLLTPDAERLTALRAQLSEAETLKAQAYAAIGEASASGFPTEHARADYHTAEQRMLDLTAAIATVETRIDAAKARAKVETLKQKRQTLKEALADLQDKARAMGETLEALRRDADALATSFDAAQAASNVFVDDRLHHHVTRGALTFKFYLMHAASRMPACKVPYVSQLKPYAENFPLPEDVETILGDRGR